MNCSAKSVKTSFKLTLRHGCLGAAMIVLASVLPSASAAKAGTINWVDWTSTGSDIVSGNILGNNVLFSGQYAFAQTVGGTNFWNPDLPYLSSIVSNEPPASDIIAFSDSGQRSLTFTTAVTDPLFAYVSMNTNTYTFDHEFDLVSNGVGFWGSGSVSKVNNGNGTWSLVAQGSEPHGVIQFTGTLSSLNWDVVVPEYWNGFTVGVAEGTPANVPGPLGVMGAAAGFGWSRRIRRKIRAASR
jgi:hypothetical protein